MKWLLDVIFRRTQWRARCVCGAQMRVRSNIPGVLVLTRAQWDARHASCGDQ